MLASLVLLAQVVTTQFSAKFTDSGDGR